MNDSESGYRVFVRTISALIFVVTFLWAVSYLFTAVVHSSVNDIYDYRQLLQFWLLALSACYSLIAFCLGQFLWPLGPRPTLTRLFIVVLVAALILAFLSPLFRKAWIDAPVESAGSIRYPRSTSMAKHDSPKSDQSPSKQANRTVWSTQIACQTHAFRLKRNLS